MAVNVGELTPKEIYLKNGNRLSIPADIIKLHSNLWHHSPHYSYIRAPLCDPTLYYHNKYHNYLRDGHDRLFSLCILICRSLNTGLGQNYF